MSFDLSTAQPVDQATQPRGGFDLATASDVAPPPAPQSNIDRVIAGLRRYGGYAANPAAQLEELAHVASSGVGALGGGLTYLGTLAATGDPAAAKAVQEETQRALTYQPTTAGGRAIATASDNALGKIPSALNRAGEATTDATGSPALGTAVNVGGNALLQAIGMRGLRGRVAPEAVEAAPAGPKAAPSTPAEQLQQSLDNGRDVGYQVTPNYDPNASFLDRLGQGIAGKAQLEQGARVQNQGVTNALAARAVGQSPTSLITQTALQQIRQAAIDQGYEPIKNLEGDIPADTQFLRAIQNIKDQSGNPLSGNPDVVATAKLLTRQSFDPAQITDQISTLRSRANDAFAQGRGTAGTAFKKQAEELEALLDRHIQDLDDVSPGILKQYRAARQLIAKTYTIENNLNPSTGNIDAIGIGKALRDGTPLTGDLRTIADFVNSAPTIAGIPQGAPLPTSPFNTMAGAAGAYATHGASLALIPAARALAARWLVQKNKTPGSLQPASKSLGQAALDAVHGNSSAFARMYGNTAPGAIVSTAGDEN